MKMDKLTPKNIALGILKYALLIFLVLVFIIPILTVFFAAFKTGEEYVTTSVLALPHSFGNLDNFKAVFKDGDMLTGFKNTTIILVFSLAGAVLSGSMAAYIFS